MTKFHTELMYFIGHQDELVRQYLDKNLVLTGESVFGAYPTMGEAYTAGVKQFGLVPTAGKMTEYAAVCLA